MKDFFQKVTLVLCLIAISILGLVFLSRSHSPALDAVGSGASTFFNGLWFAITVVFWVVFCLAVVIGIAVALVVIRRHLTTHVIYDPKDNRPVRAVIHKGEFVPMAPAGMDLAEIMKLQQQQTMHMQQYWKMFGTATTSMKSMAAFMDQYVVEADDEDDPSNTDGIEETTASKQLESPRAPERQPQIVTMHLSDDYALPANDFLSGRKLFVGTSGSGKSNSVGAYGEELGQLGVPFVLADTEDEYQPLCNPKWLKNGILAGLDCANSVTVENAAQFGAYVLTHRLQVILNLQSYEFEEAAKVLIGIISGMREWQEALPNEKRIPSDFILEEAVTWLPQYIRESPLHGTETLAQLQGTFFNDMVRKGRKRGLGLTLVCQKIAELDNRAMQSDGKLLHRQTEEADLDRYKKMGITREETLSLQNGECFLYTGRVSKMRIQIRRRNSPHGANTPGIEALFAQRNDAEMPSEMSRNFAPRRSDFEQGQKPFQNGFSETSEAAQSTVDRGIGNVPEEMKKAILGLYREGFKRTDIQSHLGLNGDEYWMIKAVCNEYDRAKGQA